MDDLETQRNTALRMLALCTVRRVSLSRRDGATAAEVGAILDHEVRRAGKDLAKSCVNIAEEIDAEVEKLRREDA